MKRPPQHVARLPRRTLRNPLLAKTIVLMTGNPTGNHLNDFKDLLHGDRCSLVESMLRHMWSSTAFTMMLTFVRSCSLYDNDALSACLAFSSNVMQSSKKRCPPWILFFFLFVPPPMDSKLAAAWTQPMELDPSIDLDLFFCRITLFRFFPGLSAAWTFLFLFFFLLFWTSLFSTAG